MFGEANYDRSPLSRPRRSCSSNQPTTCHIKRGPQAKGPHGVPQSSAVVLLGVIGVGSTAGRFFRGTLADRMGRRASLLTMFVEMAIAFAIWAISTNFWTLAVFAFVYGVFYVGWVAVLPIMHTFGARNVSGIIGILYTSVAFGTLIGAAGSG